MRFLHTSDWHLGRSFFGVSLLEDQAHVLERLVDLVKEASVDAVLVAGDVYDRSAPPADAVRLLDDTLTRLVVGLGIPVVVIAGNHDSGDRLGFGSRMLAGRGLHVAGMTPLTVTFRDAHGEIDVVAVPFCEPAASAARCGDETIADHDGALRADLAWAIASAGDGHAVGKPRGKRNLRRRVAVAHAFVSGGSVSESERPLVLGAAALVSADRFDDFTYAALGHLHRPQRIGRDEVRYSGSLLKYSFDEAAHRKGVSVVEIGGDGACQVEQVELGCRRDVRVVEGSLEEVQRASAADRSRDDYVLVRLSDRGAVIDAMGKLRECYPNCLHVQRDGFLAVLGDAEGARADLRRHTESEMFEAFFREITGDAPDEDERRAFGDALRTARREEAEAT